MSQSSGEGKQSAYDLIKLPPVDKRAERSKCNDNDANAESETVLELDAKD